MSAAPAIDVRDLSKTYEVPVREGGLAAALKSLVHRQTRQVEAVKEINFEVAPGEIVGFLGPNGAGKTTAHSNPRYGAACHVGHRAHRGAGVARQN